jgi:hypothetical protein
MRADWGRWNRVIDAVPETQELTRCRKKCSVQRPHKCHAAYHDTTCEVPAAVQPRARRTAHTGPQCPTRSATHGLRIILGRRRPGKSEPGRPDPPRSRSPRTSRRGTANTTALPTSHRSALPRGGRTGSCVMVSRRCIIAAPLKNRAFKRNESLHAKLVWTGTWARRHTIARTCGRGF